MTNEELKKKIVDVLRGNIEYELHYFPEDNYTEVEFDHDKLADALIAAGIGDVTPYKAEAEYWEKICKVKSDEYHTTIKNAVEHARHLMQERDEYKHRLEVAERPLYCLARSFAEAMCKDGDTHHLIEGFIKDAYRQAEKELAEERKDENV